MKVIVDTREQAPWTFEGQGIETIRAKLDTGDYSLEGLEDRVCIERKSIDDWIGTVMNSRARFYKELERMLAYDFRCVIIESGVREIESGNYTSEISPSSVLGFIADVTVAQSVHVHLCGTRAEAQIYAGRLLRACEKRFRQA